MDIGGWFLIICHRVHLLFSRYLYNTLMWVLLFIFFSNTEFQKAEIVGLYHTERECQLQGKHGANIGIPQGLVLTCITLKGVTEANAQKLQ